MLTKKKKIRYIRIKSNGKTEEIKVKTLNTRNKMITTKYKYRRTMLNILNKFNEQSLSNYNNI